MSEELIVFTNHTEWYVAKNLNHVKRLMKEWVGESFEELGNDENEWVELPNDNLLTIVIEKDDFDPLKDFDPEKGIVPEKHTIEEDANYIKITASCSEWIKISKPGFLCSTEY